MILWSRLKKLRAQGIRFRRQAPFRGYFLDFVCFEHRLIIEVDGGYHGEDRQEGRDQFRDFICRQEGFRVLRFWNHEVRRNLDGVTYSILMALGLIRQSQPHGPPPPVSRFARSTLPTRGRERAS